MSASSSKIREEVVSLFEAARQAKGAPYDPQRFMAFLTEPPAQSGRLVADTFRGRRHFVRFMESVELHFRICFSNEDWDKGFSLDKFVERIGAKMGKPEQAHRLARTRLSEAGRPDRLIKVGLFAGLPCAGLGIALHHAVICITFVLLWVIITGTVAYWSLQNYRHYKELVERTNGTSC